MMKIKFIFWGILCLLVAFNATEIQAQKKKKKKSSKEDGVKVVKDSTWIKLKENSVIGIGMGGGIYYNISVIELMPTVGYRVNDRIEVGLGPSYVFRNYARVFDANGDYVNGIRDINHIYGGRMYGQFVLFEPFFIRGEIEELSIKDYLQANSNTGISPVRHWVPATMLGAGYKQGRDGKSYTYLAIMYDLSSGKYSYSPYNPLVIRFGYIF